MLKKRLIYTLLYKDEAFMLSRNFRLQSVGDVAWLEENYNFKNISTSIDELIILDVSRDEPDIDGFCNMVAQVSRGCFMPLALGGKIREPETAKLMMESGADKIVLNTAFHDDKSLVRELAELYGRQCIISSIDYRVEDGDFVVYKDCGRVAMDHDLSSVIASAVELGAGEIYLNAIDKDGTGQGYLMAALEHIPLEVRVPVIIAGGAGNHNHFLEGLLHPHVDAVATANLFNFVGDGLPSAREKLHQANVPLAIW